MDQSPLQFLVSKLRTRVALSDSAERAVLALAFVERTYEPAAYLIREGSPPNSLCPMIVSGFAFRHKLTVDGARQIVSIHMRGDLLDLQHLFLDCADHNVQALTRLETINIERSALRALILEEPSIGEAMWIEALVDASIYREWVVNVGRRDGATRIAHLLCEFAARLHAAGLGDGRSCTLPMSQEQIGDATGLTSVHVNRTLKALVAGGLIERAKREISFTDLDRIRRAGEFSDAYLHLDQTRPLEAGSLHGALSKV